MKEKPEEKIPRKHDREDPSEDGSGGSGVSPPPKRPHEADFAPIDIDLPPLDMVGEPRGRENPSASCDPASNPAIVQRPESTGVQPRPDEQPKLQTGEHPKVRPGNRPEDRPEDRPESTATAREGAAVNQDPGLENESDFGQPDDEWDKWSQRVDRRLDRLEDENETNLDRIRDLRVTASKDTWKTWFHETFRQSGRVSDYVHDVVYQQVAGYSDQVK